ncbi:hypothetical protein K2173_027692 [Erythroxylum novogranatense]|uniref:Uncharacterized protein n=1 Tax=Erythroxylum novogranatense TaxID=1862640 RepID=A0AAV8U3C2_9ROSI|nr:hypothetical protein K2173_027692 [Erythroxylum novogranatense]
MSSFSPSSSSPSILLTSLPPKSPISNPKISPVRLRLTGISRRSVALLSFLALLSQPAPATAFSIGISGPKDWLKDQKRKSAKFLLAPIDASREILRSVYLLLTSSDSEFTEKESEEIQRQLKSAFRDCVAQERNSFVNFQANTGVEVCTFRLIVKNASSLLDKKDPIKLEAEAILDDLIKSFSSLNVVANEANIKLARNRQKAVDTLMDALSSLDKFEQSVKDCLEA